MLKGPIKGNPSRMAAIVDAAATVPAFFRMENDGGFAFGRVGDKDIYLAGFNALITTVALLGIKNYRATWSGKIWKGINSFFSHNTLLTPLALAVIIV